MQNLPKRLSRREACIYLRERYNIKRTPNTLAKLASTGGGPIFRKVNRTPFYEPEDIDKWIDSITSAPIASTSELGK